MQIFPSAPQVAAIFGQCDQQGQAQSGGSGFLGFIPLILIFLIFYFLLILPQQKRQKEHQKMLQSLRKGDKVITSGGIFGTIVGVKDDVVVLKIAENVKVEFLKSSVSQIVSRESEE